MDSDIRTSYIILAFSIGWTKIWRKQDEQWYDALNPSDDIFKSVVMNEVQGKSREQHNKQLAELFGTAVTKVKAFPTDGGRKWIVLDRYTKYVLHRDIANESEVDLLCLKNSYIRNK